MAKKRRLTDPHQGKKKKPSKHEAPGAGHNNRADVRARIMKKAFSELARVDSEIAAVKARHVAPLQEERGQIWKNLRNDLDAQAADLRPLYSIYKRDVEVAALDDDEARAKSQDTLKEAFETLRLGQMLDFFDVLGTGGNGHDDGPAPLHVSTARAAGREAGRAGAGADKNPHAANSDAGMAWEAGRGEGMVDNVIH